MEFIEIRILKGKEGREERERQSKRERKGEIEKRRSRKNNTFPFRGATGRGDWEWAELLS